MANEKKSDEADELKRKSEAKKPKATLSDDVAGKAYDSRLMRRLLTYLRPYKLQVGIAALAILIKAGSDVAGPYLVAVAVDSYMSPTPPARISWLARILNRQPITPMQGISEIAAIYLAALLFTFLLELLQTYLMQWTGQKVMFDMRSQIFRHLQRMSPAFFDRNPVGRLVTRVTSDVDALNEMFTSGVLEIFSNIFLLLFIMAIMLRMNWPLALLTLSVIPAILYVTGIFRRKVRDSYRRQRTATAKINSFTQEYVSGMAVVQLFNRERRAIRDFSEVNDENKRAWEDAILAYSWYYPVVEFLSSTAIAIVLWRGGLAVLHNNALLATAHSLGLQSAHSNEFGFFGSVSLGVLIGFVQYAQRFFRPIQELSEKYNILQAAMAASERIFRLLDIRPKIVSPAESKQGDGSGSIEFRNVWFTYQTLSDEQQHRLRSVILDPATSFSSAILLDPVLSSIEWILRGVSFTIAAGETAAIVGHTGAGKTTITSLMMRFYEIQHGAILVLDEATSSVDTETEHRVRLALERMITGRTSVLIAHRLSTVQSAAVILVMHKGQLREQGSHQELLAQRGLYYKLYQLQYKDQELAVATT